jgi:hypothetical protein
MPPGCEVGWRPFSRAELFRCAALAMARLMVDTTGVCLIATRSCVSHDRRRLPDLMAWHCFWRRRHERNCRRKEQKDAESFFASDARRTTAQAPPGT